MKSIKVKIIASVILCALLSAMVCGGLSILTSKTISTETSREYMLLCTQNASAVLDRMMGNVELSVENLYSVVLERLDDVEAFKTDPAYVESYTESIDDVLLEIAKNTNGALTAYIRYNPEFTDPTSGLFYTRDSSNGEFTKIEPTDFTMYEPDDLEHVGWYYIPVNNGKPTWMEPYLNSNINVYMVSYVIPIFIDGESIGILGMDIEFNTFTNLVDESNIFNAGYAYLANADGKIMYHKELDVGTNIADADSGLAEAAAAITNDSQENTFISYRYKGQQKNMFYTILTNGMRYVMTVPEKDLLARSTNNTIAILLGALVAVILSAIIGVILSFGIARPITQITDAVKRTAEFNFAHNPANAKLFKRADETGVMAQSLHNMRANLRTMISDIQQTYSDLKNTMNQLSEMTDHVNTMSLENSDTTQELAAAMEQTAATMENVNQMLGNIRERSSVIKERSEEGLTTSTESKNRADNLKSTTDAATSKTSVMYEEVSHKAEEAMEQAKAVEKINQLTQAILDISSQTNLLALNASIEAAHAGAAGESFAVVADEIRELADNSRDTANNIQDISTDVTEAVGTLAKSANVILKFIDESVLVDYDKFVDIINQYHDDADSMGCTLREFDNSSKVLEATISQMTEGMNGINIAVEESSQGITMAADNTSRLAKLLVDIRGLAEDNQEISEELKVKIQQFKNI